MKWWNSWFKRILSLKEAGNKMLYISLSFLSSALGIPIYYMVHTITNCLKTARRSRLLDKRRPAENAENIYIFTSSSPQIPPSFPLIFPPFISSILLLLQQQFHISSTDICAWNFWMFRTGFLFPSLIFSSILSIHFWWRWRWLPTVTDDDICPKRRTNPNVPFPTTQRILWSSLNFTDELC